MRGCLARGGIWGAKMRRIEKKVLPRIQARIRGFLARKKYYQCRLEILQTEKAKIIQHAFLRYKIRLACRKERRLTRIRQNEEEAALIFQKVCSFHVSLRYSILRNL